MSMALVCSLMCAIAGAQNAPISLPRIAQDQLSVLSYRISERIQRAQLEPAYTKVVVFDFFSQTDKQVSKLGSFLADTLSEALASQARGFAVFDRKLLADYMKDNWIDPREVKEVGVALAVARSMGASGIIWGNLREDVDHQLKLVVRAVGLGPSWEDEAGFLATEDMETLSHELVPSFIRSPVSIPLEPGVLRAGINGAGVPTCVFCPPPTYNGVARAAKYQGKVELSLVVTAEGQVKSVLILKGEPFLLNKQAIEAVQQWRFRPAEKDGKPVSVRVPVDITFRLY